MDLASWLVMRSAEEDHQYSTILLVDLIIQIVTRIPKEDVGIDATGGDVACRGSR